MPDFMDQVQEQVQAATDAAIADAVRPRHGREACDLCGEPISDLRRRLGARLCLAHQEERERGGRR